MTKAATKRARRTLNPSRLVPVDLTKRDGCNHPDIRKSKRYLAEYDDLWFTGKFSKQWYGWNLEYDWAITCGIQLDSITRLWEIV